MKITLEKKYVFILAVIVGMLVMSIYSALFPGAQNAIVDNKTAEDYTQQAWKSLEQGYDLEYVESLFEKALSIDVHNEQALYSLARIYYITQKYNKSFEMIAHYKDEYPENKRIHYIAGLAYAYAGDLNTAQNELQTFIDSGIASWPGYLDMAWVLFQKGDYNIAQKTLEGAVEEFGDNVWLNTSLGAIAIAQGENTRAQEYLLTAQEQAEELTAEEWQRNYSFNNPQNTEEHIQKMKEVIAHNISLARGEQPEQLAILLQAPFVGYSPDGVGKGLVVSACGDSCAESSCISEANICGNFNVGTQNSCTGNICSATAPADPTATTNCTITTDCGNAMGTLGCNGQCNVSQIPICGISDTGGGTGGTNILFPADTGSIVPGQITAQITAIPLLVESGTTTRIAWVSVETDSCDITGTNGDEWLNQTIYGSQESSSLMQETTYTLTCRGYDGTVITDSVVVQILPAWNEQ